MNLGNVICIPVVEKLSKISEFEYETNNGELHYKDRMSEIQPSTRHACMQPKYFMQSFQLWNACKKDSYQQQWNVEQVTPLGDAASKSLGVKSSEQGGWGMVSPTHSSSHTVTRCIAELCTKKPLSTTRTDDPSL